MLLPDNIHPQLSVFYSGAMVLEEFKNTNVYEIDVLFSIVKEKHSMSLSTFILSMDWLYLVDAVVVDEEGCARKCI